MGGLSWEVVLTVLIVCVTCSGCVWVGGYMGVWYLLCSMLLGLRNGEGSGNRME